MSFFDGAVSGFFAGRDWREGRDARKRQRELAEIEENRRAEEFGWRRDEQKFRVDTLSAQKRAREQAEKDAEEERKAFAEAYGDAKAASEGDAGTEAGPGAPDLNVAPDTPAGERTSPQSVREITAGRSAPAYGDVAPTRPQKPPAIVSDAPSIGASLASGPDAPQMPAMPDMPIPRQGGKALHPPYLDPAPNVPPPDGKTGRVVFAESSGLPQPYIAKAREFDALQAWLERGVSTDTGQPLSETERASAIARLAEFDRTLRGAADQVAEATGGRKSVAPSQEMAHRPQRIGDRPSTYAPDAAPAAPQPPRPIPSDGLGPRAAFAEGNGLDAQTVLMAQEADRMEAMLQDSAMEPNMRKTVEARLAAHEERLNGAALAAGIAPPRNPRATDAAVLDPRAPPPQMAVVPAGMPSPPPDTAMDAGFVRPAPEEKVSREARITRPDLPIPRPRPATVGGVRVPFGEKGVVDAPPVVDGPPAGPVSSAPPAAAQPPSDPAAPQPIAQTPPPQQAAPDGVPLTEQGTPATSVDAAQATAPKRDHPAKKGVIGEGMPVKATQKQREKAGKDFLTYYAEKGAPRIVEHYLKTGQVEKAVAFRDFIQDEQVKAGMKSWSMAAHAAAIGDDEGFVKYLAEAYNRRGYFDDGFSVVAEDSGLIRDKSGSVTGAQITYKKDGTGEIFVEKVDSLDNLYEQGLWMLSPEKIFETGWNDVQAGRAARAEVTKKLAEAGLPATRAKAVLDTMEKLSKSNLNFSQLPVEEQVSQAIAFLDSGGATPTPPSATASGVGANPQGGSLPFYN